jgi:hypothetical protein
MSKKINVTYHNRKFHPVGWKKFDSGEEGSQYWASQPELVKSAYDDEGVKGVMALTGTKKTQAYALVAKLGLLKKKIVEKNKARLVKFDAEVEAGRRKYLQECFGWTDGQDTLNVVIGNYDFAPCTKIGGRIMFTGKFYTGRIPRHDALEFARQRGALFYGTPEGKILIDVFHDCYVFKSRKFVLSPQELQKIVVSLPVS